MNWGSKFKDGSLRVDIPLESLHLLFNVNYSIVSQGESNGRNKQLPFLISRFLRLAKSQSTRSP